MTVLTQYNVCGIQVNFVFRLAVSINFVPACIQQIWLDCDRHTMHVMLTLQVQLSFCMVLHAKHDFSWAGHTMPDLGPSSSLSSTFSFTTWQLWHTLMHARKHARTHIICVSQLSALHGMMKKRLHKSWVVWFRQSQQGLAISSAVWSRPCAKTSASLYARCCIAFRGT